MPWSCMTGNNLVIQGDMTRRVIPIELDAQCERPELRAFDRELLPWVDHHRGQLVADALTVLSAWRKAGRPCRTRLHPARKLRGLVARDRRLPRLARDARSDRRHDAPACRRSQARPPAPRARATGMSCSATRTRPSAPLCRPSSLCRMSARQPPSCARPSSKSPPTPERAGQAGQARACSSAATPAASSPSPTAPAFASSRPAARSVRHVGRQNVSERVNLAHGSSTVAGTSNTVVDVEQLGRGSPGPQGSPARNARQSAAFRLARPKHG